MQMVAASNFDVKTCPKHALNTPSSDFHHPFALRGSYSNSWLWRNISTWKLLSRETQTKLTLSKHLKNVVLHLGIKVQPICHSLPPCPRLPIQLGVRLSLKVYLLSWPSEFWYVSSKHWACWPISSIVFVHGLLGHRTETWTKDGVCWPRDLLSTEETLSHIRVLTFGYDANVVHLNGPASLNSLLGHSISLLSELARERRKAAVSDPIFSVAIYIQMYLAGPALDFCCSLSRWTDNQRCMSLNCIPSSDHHLNWLSLQALDYSDRHKDTKPLLAPIFPATKGIIFLGTPHRGSGKTSLARVVASIAQAALQSTNSALIQDLERDAQTLDRIRDSFSGILDRRTLTIWSFEEELPMGIGLVYFAYILEKFNWYSNSCASGCQQGISHSWWCPWKPWLYSCWSCWHVQVLNHRWSRV